jgi:uncharacterized membrane protein
LEILEELWQFSHITVGFQGRVLLGALLLAYGMIVNQPLVIIASLLFLPSLPLLLAIGFGIQTREWRLARQGVLALATSVGLTIIGGAIIGRVIGPPMHFTTFNTTLVSALIALTTGVAAGLALPDDAGRRELIGLAAASQISLPAVWLGISLAFGAPAGDGTPLMQRGLSLLLNIVVIIVAGLLTARVFGMKGTTIQRFTTQPRLQEE